MPCGWSLRNLLVSKMPSKKQRVANTIHEIVYRPPFSDQFRFFGFTIYLRTRFAYRCWIRNGYGIPNTFVNWQFNLFSCCDFLLCCWKCVLNTTCNKQDHRHIRAPHSGGNCALFGPWARPISMMAEHMGFKSEQ